MDIIKLIRPTQWCKNLFVFLPLFFAGNIGDMSRLIPCIVIFFVISLLSSSVYVFNDLCDAQFDSRHPEKCHRPIASGRVSKAKAFAIFIFLAILSFVILAVTIPRVELFVMLGVYLLLNLCYSLWLKSLSLIDLFFISVCFILRILIGAAAAQVEPSHWIIVMTFLLALFLVLAKRRDDVLKFETSHIVVRRNVKSYNLAFIDHAITLVAAITLVSYIMYTVDDEITQRFDCNYVYATSIFVLAGLLRYLQITFVEKNSGSPTKVVLHDRFLQLCIVGWILLFVFIIYG